jgi:cardiolipin synthase A/B
LTAVPGGLRETSWRRLGRRLLTPFPETGGNAVLPLQLEDAYFERMLAAIADAEVSVDVEMYMWDDDDLGRRFLAALAQRARDGRRVRVLVDAWGAHEVIGPPLARLSETGATVRVFNRLRFPLVASLFHRTHKKLLIIDGCIAFSGGAGFSLHFTRGKHRERPWHDRMYELRGPIVHQLVTTFDVDFARWGRRREALDLTGQRSSACYETEQDARGRVLRGWPDSRDFPEALIEAVEAAHQAIRIGTPYFIPRVRLLAALIRAQHRGVSVELVLPERRFANPIMWAASRRAVGLLLRAGVRVFAYDVSFYHAKIAVVDERAALIGSSNLDPWSWRRNAELDLLFVDAPTVRGLGACFAADRERSNEITLESYRDRGLLGRFYERIAGRFADWL